MLDEAALKDMRIATRLIRQKEYDEAFELLLPLAADFGDDAGVWWLLANAAAKNQPSEAIVALENLLDIQPSHREGKKLMSLVRRKQRSLDSFATSERTFTGTPDDFSF